MHTHLNAYLNFKDTAREAMTFYHSVFGGKLEMTTFKDGMGGMPVDPADENKIMHAVLEAENGITFMASDSSSEMTFVSGAQISLSLSGDNDTELRGYWEKLSSEGTVIMPLEVAPWGDAFGMVKDRFGIQWMVNISPKKA